MSKIDLAPLITDSQIAANPNTQLPTGFTGDLATNYTQITNYALNQIGFAPLFDSNTKGQAIDLNARDLNALEAAGFTTSGLYAARANCTNNPLAEDGLLFWDRGHINYQSMIWKGVSGRVFYNSKNTTWKGWSEIQLGLNYGVASGTNTYTVTIQGIFSLTVGLAVRIKFTNAPTNSATLNINGLGAKPLVMPGGYPVENGTLGAGEIWEVMYDGTSFRFASDPYVKTYDLLTISTVSGTNTYTVASTGFAPLGSYIFGSKIRCYFTNGNTGASTLNVNSIGAAPLTKNGTSALISGDIHAGQFVDITYDGSNFQILGKI